MRCSDAEHFANLSLDEELEWADQAAFEAHLQSCPDCGPSLAAKRERQMSIRRKLRESASGVCTPPGLRTRIRMHLPKQARKSRLGAGVWLATLVAIATLSVLSWNMDAPRSWVLEDAVRRHRQNFPPEVYAGFNGSQVDPFLRDHFRHPVTVPRFRKQHPDGRLVGARLSTVGDRDAAHIMYENRGTRISLFVLPSPWLAARTTRFEARSIGEGRSILIDQQLGYNIVAWEHDKVVYVMVSDVDSSALIRLASSAR